MSTTILTEKRPKVSVLMITYNHEKFIEQAIRSVMMQETDFDYELVIGEDCSTDNTRDIVLKMKEEFPDKIKLLLHEQNVGMIPNVIATYNACDGEYIALIEGDDFWVDPKKLQVQVDYMDAHPQCRLCFHAAQVMYENLPDRIEIIKPPVNHIVNFRNWLFHRGAHRNYIPTASIVFRSPNCPLPNWFSKLSAAGDWPLVVWLLKNGGELTFIDTSDCMSVYRKHVGGITSNVNFSHKKADLADHLFISQYLDKNLRASLFLRIYKLYSLLTDHFAYQNDYLNAWLHYFKSLSYIRKRQQVAASFRQFLRIFMPNIYSRIKEIRESNVKMLPKGR